MDAAAAAGFPRPSRLAARKALAVVTSYATVSISSSSPYTQGFFTNHLIDHVWQFVNRPVEWPPACHLELFPVSRILRSRKCLKKYVGNLSLCRVDRVRA